jgi:hypothetical protein
MTVLVFVLSGCAQLMNPQAQPVVVKDANQQIIYTTCSGLVEDWGTCHSKAMKTCPNNYIVLDKIQESNGVFRSVTFQCKK